MEHRARRVFFLGSLLVLLVIPALGGDSALAASCYTTSSRMHDICPTGTDPSYDGAASLRGGIAVVNGARRLVYAHPNSLDVWDLTSPMSPSRATSQSLAIRSGGFTGRDDDSHWYQIDHIKHVATLDGLGYAFCSLYNYGWQVLQFAPSVSWAGGYEPASPNGAPPYYFSQLFRADGTVYLVSRNLRGSNDPTHYIYIFDGIGKAASGFSAASLDERQPTRVPMGTTADGVLSGLRATAEMTYRVYEAGSSRYLLLQPSGGSIGVVDISNPLMPTPVALWTTANLPQVDKGPFVVDSARNRMYIANRSSDTVYTIDLTSIASPSLLYTTTWPGAGGSTTGMFTSLAGDLLVVAYYRTVGMINVAGANGPTAITEQADGITDLTRSCAKGFGDTVSDVSAFVAGGQFYFVRFLTGSGDVVAISSSCLSTTPKPDMSVALSTLEPGTYPCTTTADAKGYPGDVFTIANATTGSWQDPELVIKKGGVLVVRKTTGWSGSNTITWTPATDLAVGEYTADVEVTAQGGGTVYSTADSGTNKTKKIYLCGAAKASAAVLKVNNSTGALSWLTNDSLTVGAGNPTSTGTLSRSISQGHPSAYDWRFVTPVGAPSVDDTQAAEPAVTLAAQGTYKVLLVAHYEHDTTDNTSCTAAADTDLQGFYDEVKADYTGSYDSCALLTLESQPFNVGALQFLQGTSSTQPFLVTQAITLRAPCARSSAWTPTYDFSVEGATVTSKSETCGQTGGGFMQGTVAANTYTEAGSHLATLTASATDGQQRVPAEDDYIRNASFNVTKVSGTITNTPTSPKIGDTVSFSLLGFDGITVTRVDWNFGGPGCTGADPATKSCTSSLFGCTGPDVISHGYSSSGAKSVTATVTTDGGPIVVSKTVTVQTTGSCGSTTTTTTGGGSSTTTTASSCGESSAPTVDFTWTPTAVIVGQQMQFKVSVATGNPTKWYWDFGDGSDSTQREPFHTFATAGDYVVTFQAENCKGLGNLRSRTVAVAGNCTEAAAPVAAITTNIPEPKVGDEVKFTDASTGTVSSREWTIKNGAGQTVHSELGSTPSEARFIVYPFMQIGTFTVSLKTTNCKGSNTKVLEVQVRSRCDQTQSPVADFTWGPTGPADGFPSQQRPYEGQEVQLTDASTNAPDGWHWYDFQEVPAANYSIRNPKHTWQLPGEKTVRLIATNCFGSGSETSKKVTVYEDNRPVTADFTWIVQTLEEADATVPTGVPVKFTAATGYAKGDPNEFSFRFGDDDSTPGGATVNHTFLCRGKVQVAMIARRKLPSGRVVTGNVTKTIEVTGNVCGPESLVAPDAAQVPGLNGTSWRTDLRIFNPGTQPTQVWLAVLPAGQNNAQPFQVGPYMVPAKGTQALNNILQMFELLLQKNYTKAAVRVTYESPEDEHPIVIGRTYTDVDGGGTYGQYVPGIPVIANSTTSPLWITGLRHDGTEHGFRTNLGFANLRGDAGGVTGMHVSLLDGTGALRASKTLNLAPYGYLLDTLKNLFGEAAETVGVFSLKIELPTDTDVQPYASVVDNLTGDNILISAVPPVEDVVFLPAVAHNKGEAGTVWRTSVQLTNTDDEAHATEIKFFPKGGSVPGTFRSISLAPGQSARTEDLIEWIYSPLIAPDASGVVRIAPGDASRVMPAVAARTYNLTANGTFGQDVPPLQGSMGIVKGGENERMFITGMSSADVARTNLGFVCLSDTQGVDFAVYFYDGDGNLLNPEGKPYTFALGANGWDQDKLENRFKNFFKQDLPANLEVISAEIIVRTGGPGFAYASVIDNITGDPIFVPGHASP